MKCLGELLVSTDEHATFVLLRDPSNLQELCSYLSGEKESGNDHGFIRNEYISIRMRPFGKLKSKVTRA